MKKRFTGLVGELEVEIKDAGDVTIVELCGPIDTDTAENLANILQESLSKERIKFVLDLTKVDYIARAGLSAIVNTKTKVFRKGGNLHLVGLGGKVKDVFQASGLLNIFELFDEQKKAIQKL